MILIRHFVLWVFIFSCFMSFSQKILWEQSYGGIHAEHLMDAIPTADYGFILAGSSVSGKTGNKKQDNAGNLDYWIWKMNEHGEQEWQKSIGGEGRDLLYSISHTFDGGFILGGSSDSDATEGIKKEDCKGNEDYWVVKLDAGGAIEWERTLGGKGQDILTKVIPTKDGGYILGGSSGSDQSEDKKRDCRGGLDFWIVKLDNKGKTEWETTLGGQYQELLRSMVITDDGGYLLGGYTNSPTSDDKSTDNLSGDFWVVKLDKDGRVEWERTYGGDGNDDLYVLLPTQDGNYILGGHSNSSFAKSGTDVLLIKIDKNGLPLWQDNYDIGLMDLLTSLTEAPDGTLIAGINSKGVNHPNTKSAKKKEGIDDYILMKLSAEGREDRTRNIGSSGVDILKKVIITRDEGYLLAGTSEANRPSRQRNSQMGGNDFWVVKLADEDKEKVKKLDIEAFPNPALNYTNVVVGYDYERGTATLFDINGRQLQKFELSGSRTIPVNMSGLPMGVYVVQIETDVQKDGIKIMKK